MFRNPEDFLDEEDSFKEPQRYPWDDPVDSERTVANITSQSNPDITMTARADVPKRAASDQVRPDGVELFAALQNSADLTNRNQLQRLKIIQLEGYILETQGKSALDISEEYSKLKDEQSQWVVRETTLEAEIVKLRKREDDLTDQIARIKAEYDTWVDDATRQNQLLTEKLDEVRRRFPHLDDTIDPIFGDAHQREVGDLQEEIAKLELVQRDLVAENENYKRQLSEWNTSAVSGEKTFDVNVGELHKHSYQQRIEELTRAIDERDQQLKAKEEELLKTFHVIKTIEKAKARLEQQHLDQSSQIFRDQIASPRGRQQAADKFMCELQELKHENKELRERLIRLGATVRERSMHEESLNNDNDLQGLLDYAEALQNDDRSKNEKLFNFSEHDQMDAAQASMAADQEEIANVERSFAAFSKLDEARALVDTLKDSVQKLFARCQASAALLLKIQDHLSAADPALAAELRQLSLQLDESIKDDVRQTIEELEASFQEASWILEQSINESRLEISLTERAGGGSSGVDVNKSLSRLFALSPKAAGSPRIFDQTRFVKKEQFDELNTKYEALNGQYEALVAEYEDVKNKLDYNMKLELQKNGELAKTRATYDSLKSQYEELQRFHAQAEMACSEMKEQNEALGADRTRDQQNLVEAKRDVEAHKALVAELEDKLREREQGSAHQLARLESKTVEMAEHAEYLLSEIEGYKGEIEQLEADNEKLLKQNRDNQAELQSKAELHARLQEQVQEMETVCKQAKASASQHSRTDEQLQSLEHALLQVRTAVGQLARIRGDKNDASAASRPPPSGKPILERITELITELEKSVNRACEWTRHQEKEMRENNQRAKNMESLLKQMPVTSNPAPPASTSSSAAELRSSATDTKENRPAEAAVQKYKDPLREVFYQLCTRTNALVQLLKGSDATKRVGTGEVLQLARDLRDVVTKKFHAVSKTPVGAEELHPSELLERIAMLLDQNSNLTAALNGSKALLKELQSGAKGGCKLDAVLAVEVGDELQKIRATLLDCRDSVGGSSSKRQPLTTDRQTNN
ncbi:unnamed protein product, partial [Mesorhabditis spiculigera]